MNPLIDKYHAFFARAKEKRDTKKAEKMASEFQGSDICMGEIGNFTFEEFCAIGPSALPALLSIFSKGKPVILNAKVRASIAAMKTPGGVSMLLSALSDPGNEHKHSACLVLGIWKEKSAVEKLVSIALDKSEQLSLRIMAVQSLGDIGDISATAPLLSIISTSKRLLADKEEYRLSKACIDELGHIGDKSAISRLRDLALPPSLHSCSAIVALARLGDIESVPLMMEMARPGSIPYFDAGAKALCIIADPRGAPLLAELLRTKVHKNELSCKMEIIKALGEFGDPCAIPVLFTFISLNWGSEAETWEAIASLAKFKCDEAYSLLVDLIHKSNFKFNNDIQAAIFSIGAPAVPFLIHKLDSDKWATPATLLADMGYGIAAVNHYRKLTIQKPEMRFEFDKRVNHIMCQMHSRKILLLNAQKIDFSAMPLKRAFMPRTFLPASGASTTGARMQKSLSRLV